ncbi:UDP-N-acetylglucosamine transferase subunit ALG14 [Epargyreus clarus]|uniref:UDP-N-acetylglucosamine transferase subunit ALG14 n=1 Tax=Epargyreus clarus TaxID=520877 RepID=UPI003C2FD72E
MNSDTKAMYSYEYFVNLLFSSSDNLCEPVYYVPSWMGMTSALFAIAALLLLVRAIYLSFRVMTTQEFSSTLTTFKIIICIGSGGHTTEMIELVKHLNATKYRPRLYVIADDDYTSEARVCEFENGSKDYAIAKIPRSRNVKQSYFSSIFSTIRSFLSAIPLIFKFKPDAILCNGPGTCIPVCLTAFLFRCLFMLKCRIVFVESVCRVRTLSLTGSILQFVADIFVVQWPQLKANCLRAQYYGRLT